MKIRIKTNDYREFEEFPIVSIKYDIDETGVPVDIVIRANEETLEHIAEFSSIGWNMKELDDYEREYTWAKGATHEALYARLNHFNVLEANKVLYL